MNRRWTLEVLFRVNWLAVAVVVLVVTAIVWVVINPLAYPQCLTLCVAAVPLALIAREVPE